MSEIDRIRPSEFDHEEKKFYGGLDDIIYRARDFSENTSFDEMMEDTGDKQVNAVVSGLCQLAVVAEMARGEEFTEAQSEQLDDAVMDALATMSHKKLDPKLLRNLSILIARLWHARLDRDRDEHKARNLAGVDLDAKTAFEDRMKIVYKAVVGKRGD